jgi:hypothetical protein
MNAQPTAAQTAAAALTPAQVVALRALRTVDLAKRGAYTEATDLAVSPAALASLVRKGLARTSPSISRMHGWDVAAYRITAEGRTASLYLPKA